MIECWDERLVAEGSFIKSITEKTDAEDSESKSITGSERIAIEEAGESFVAVLLAGNDALKKSMDILLELPYM